MVEPDLDYIQLVKSNEVLNKILHHNSLFSITMDPPLSLQHARDKISEITCLRTFNSVYAPNFQFNLIEDYGVDNNFLVHQICITCDNFRGLVGLLGDEFPHMFTHFDMTSNIELIPNNLLHDHLFRHVVACNLENINFRLPILGWFNDEHYKFQDHAMCFTDICKRSCDISYSN
jgi:hypothetical protein